MFEKFGYPEYSTEGEQVITTRTGIYKYVQMDIRVYKIKGGEEKAFIFERDEAAILLLTGLIRFRWEDSDEMAERNNVFTEGPTCLHAARKTLIIVTALDDSEILVQATDNKQYFESKYYTTNDCSESMAGEGLCKGMAPSLVRTIFDYTNAPYSNMVMGEIISGQGNWSSYLPHSHVQPEVYYYKFDKPQGFGACFIGEDVFKITNGSFSAIQGGLTHPQVTAPEYEMYSCWMLRHLEQLPLNSILRD